MFSCEAISKLCFDCHAGKYEEYEVVVDRLLVFNFDIGQYPPFLSRIGNKTHRMPILPKAYFLSLYFIKCLTVLLC